MSKRLIVHIGANKTGSSAIQRFLKLNVLALREAGIVVPNANLEYSDQIEGRHVWTFQEMFANPEEGRDRLERAIERIFELAPQSSALLLSAENLAANAVAPRLFEGLVERYDLELVLYIRRQDDFILSTWQQWYSKIHEDFWSWLVPVLGTLGNWQLYIETWASIVPRDNMKIRVFDRNRLTGGDVTTDFANHLRLDVSKKAVEEPEIEVNPSYATAVMDLVSGNDLIFENVHDNDFYRFVDELTGDTYHKNSKESSITFSQRNAILRRYADSNHWVEAQFFPSLETPIFSPLKKEDMYFETAASLQKQQLQFLTTMLYRMWRQRPR